MTSRSFLDGRVTLHAGDSRTVIAAMPAASVDSVVTDPPYGLGFMGKAWDSKDGAAFAAEFWAEVLRVLKPGGHVVAFSGTRTYHRMVCAIEDAGFEIRDSLYWHYGSGFPKSHNISKVLKTRGACCCCHMPMLGHHNGLQPEDLRDLRCRMDADDAISSCAEPNLRAGVLGRDDRQEEERAAASTIRTDGLSRGDVPGLRQPVLPSQGVAETECAGLLQHNVPLEDVCRPASAVHGEHEGEKANPALRPGKLGLEGRCHPQAAEGQLLRGEIHPRAAVGAADGAGGRLHHGTPARDGDALWLPPDQGGGGESQGPSAEQQFAGEPGTVADECGPQAWGGWPVCGRCRKPVVPEGLGTALKPATEPIVLARKPLAGTVAETVLAHGTGALNIDGCRVPTDDRLGGGDLGAGPRKKAEGWARPWMTDPAAIADHAARMAENVARAEALGRWPANLVHDGSDEVVAAFPDAKGAVSNGRKAVQGVFMNGLGAVEQAPSYGDSGSAARFFYSAKAGAEDRLGSKHPTVKPLDLMRWLVRLVTPPGGMVLDPFAGTGTTGEAAWREGFSAVLVEREAAYQEDINRRMKLANEGRIARSAAKFANKRGKAMSLFGEES